MRLPARGACTLSLNKICAAPFYFSNYGDSALNRLANNLGFSQGQLGAPAIANRSNPILTTRSGTPTPVRAFPLIGKALPCFDQSSRSLSCCTRPPPSPSSSNDAPALRRAGTAAPWRRSPATIRSAIRSGKACRRLPRLNPIGTGSRSDGAKA